MSRRRPRDANLRAVGHLKHELIRIAVIGDVSDASPIGSGRALLSRRPLLALWAFRAFRAFRALRSFRTFRTDKVHERSPGPILLAKQVAAGRVQVDVAFFPQRSLRVRASMQKIHTATSYTAYHAHRKGVVLPCRYRLAITISVIQCMWPNRRFSVVLYSHP